MNTTGTATAVPQAAGVLGGEVGLQSAAQVGLSLLLVVAAIAFLAWLLRRLTHLQSSALGGLRVVGGLSIGGRERVVLLEAGEQQLLLGVSPGSVRTLHVFERPLRAQPDAAEAQSSFSARLQRALRG